MIIKMVLIGFFLVQSVDYDNGRYNVLLAQQGNTNLIATWSHDKIQENTTLHLKIEAECSQVYEVLEGNGKRGSGWDPKDDWYVNSRPWLCTATNVETYYE